MDTYIHVRMRGYGNILVAIIEWKAEWARLPLRCDGTDWKRHSFFLPLLYFERLLIHVLPLPQSLGYQNCQPSPGHIVFGTDFEQSIFHVHLRMSALYPPTLALTAYLHGPFHPGRQMSASSEEVTHMGLNVHTQVSAKDALGE